MSRKKEPFYPFTITQEEVLIGIAGAPKGETTIPDLIASLGIEDEDTGRYIYTVVNKFHELGLLAKGAKIAKLGDYEKAIVVHSIAPEKHEFVNGYLEAKALRIQAALEQIGAMEPTDPGVV